MLRLYRGDISVKGILWQWASTPTFGGYVVWYMVTILAELLTSLPDFPQFSSVTHNKCWHWTRLPQIPPKFSPPYCEIDLLDWVTDCVEIWTVLKNYAVCHCNYLQKFRDNLSVPSSRVKKGYFFLLFCIFDPWRWDG